MNDSFDVIVVGAGVSGSTAAVASARHGAKTLLIEKECFLGGVGYSGLFQYICGLYLNSDDFPASGALGTLNQGIVSEIVVLLNESSPQKAIKKIGFVYVLPYSRADLLSVFNSLCYNESNLSVLPNATVVSINKKDGEITELVVNSSGSIHRISPNVVIDCTGNGDVSAMSGASFELSSPEKIQLSGYTVHIKGIKSIDEILSLKVAFYLDEGVRTNMLPQYMRFSTFSHEDGSGEGYLKISLGRADDAEQDKKAREDASLMHRYLSDTIQDFKDSYIADTSLRVMDREGRRVCGEYTLTEDDVANARKFDDGIVKNSWPIEIWDKDKGSIYRYVKHNDYYEIPLRCLKVMEISNLFCAGRCISVSAEALGSTRVMGTCMSLGEQAGLAAAHKIKNGIYP